LSVNGGFGYKLLKNHILPFFVCFVDIFISPSSAAIYKHKKIKANTDIHNRHIYKVKSYEQRKKEKGERILFFVIG